MIDFVSTAPTTGTLDVSWRHGSPPHSHRHEPPIQVHWYDEHTAILRQSKDVTFEAPFLFLLFGNDRALLLDSGATKDDTVRVMVDDLVETWLTKHPRPRYRLVVAHTHGHGDHIGGDVAFYGRRDTDVVGHGVEDVRVFFGFTSWPEQIVTYDLGGRVLTLSGIPGHHAASIAVHDPWTGLLFTGDSVMPGRLYVSDMRQYLDSVERLVAFADGRTVIAVLGCHVEMSGVPGKDYFPGCRYQPNEKPLQLPVAILRDVHAAVRQAAATPGVYVQDDFIIYNGMGWMATARLNVRQILGSARTAFSRG